MWVRSGAFIALALLLAAGCSQHYVLRMSTPELSNFVTLLDSGTSKGKEDDGFVVLDEPARIEKAAAFFKARSSRWEPLNDAPPVPRYEITFRKKDKVTDRFWMRDDRLCLMTPEGRYFVCSLSEAERAELLSIFHFPANFKSFERT